jgi:hypothetical protein
MTALRSDSPTRSQPGRGRDARRLRFAARCVRPTTTDRHRADEPRGARCRRYWLGLRQRGGELLIGGPAGTEIAGVSIRLVFIGHRACVQKLLRASQGSAAGARVAAPHFRRNRPPDGGHGLGIRHSNVASVPKLPAPPASLARQFGTAHALPLDHGGGQSTLETFSP